MGKSTDITANDVNNELIKLFKLHLSLNTIINNNMYNPAIPGYYLYTHMENLCRSTESVFVKLYTNNRELVLNFEIKRMIGCCAFAVSTNTIVYNKYKNKGYATKLQKVKEDLVRFLGYSNMIATVTSDNVYQIKIMEKCGWDRVDAVLNRRTGNTVYTYIKKIGPEFKDTRSPYEINKTATHCVLCGKPTEIKALLDTVINYCSCVEKYPKLISK